MENFDDTFLARWIAGEASPEEVAAFKKHPDYKKYEHIQEASNALSFIEFNEEEAFNELKIKLSKTTKIRPLYTWIASIAACAVVTIGFLFFSNQSKVYKSTIAQQTSVELPDGSKMVLNASAEAEVDIKNWNINRNVFLKGEAFFKVKKGSAFTVNTSLGSVQVLGTQFSVNTVSDQLIIVKCFEGKVKVISTTGEALLTKGMAFQDHKSGIEKWTFNENSPNWITAKETTLYKVPVKQVIMLLKRQYDLSIQQQELLNKEKLFTGTFSNTNLEKALYSVFGVLGVNYTLISENEIRILEE